MSTTSDTSTHPVPRLPDGRREMRPRGTPRLPVWQALLGAVCAGGTTWVALVAGRLPARRG